MNRSYIFFSIILFFFISCSEKKKTNTTPEEISQPEKTSDLYLLSEKLQMGDCEPISKLELYEFSTKETNNKEVTGFVSLSDNYHPDSLAIPNMANKEITEAEYFVLDSIYRERFLLSTGISETDSLFIYNYAYDILKSFHIKDLKVVASLSNYVESDSWPYTQEDYMIGFELKDKLLPRIQNFSNHTLVSTGQESPFVQGEMKPLKWKRISSQKFPPGSINLKRASNSFQFKIGNAWTFKSTDFHYYLKELTRNKFTVAYYLLVQKAGSKEIVKEKIYYESEGESLTSLNKKEESKENQNQWTGKLFKDLPPVMFGFQYHSFGCPGLTILEKTKCDLEINCDNRH